MNQRDIKVGGTVYHCIFTHLGKGEVLSVGRKNGLEAIFDRGGGPWRIMVRFEHSDGKVHRVTSRCIRKTPNRKKMREMVAVYADRGQTAIAATDRLILPAEVRAT